MNYLGSYCLGVCWKGEDVTTFEKFEVSSRTDAEIIGSDVNTRLTSETGPCRISSDVTYEHGWPEVAAYTGWEISSIA